MKPSTFPLACAAILACASVAAASGVDPTRLSLPKGPGSIEGLGRSFVPSLASGTSSYGVEIAVPPAVGGFGPRIALEYDSGGGVTELGMGWSLGGIPRIRVRTEEGLPRWDGTETWELSGLGTPCELLRIDKSFYRPRYESGAFVRVQRSADGGTWEARDKSGTTFRFGGEGYTEKEGSANAAFLLREQLDTHGHRIRYDWDTASGYALLTRVVWNELNDSHRNELAFAYEERPDQQLRFSSGIRQELTRRLRTIDVTHGGSLVRRYTLAYAPGSHSKPTSVGMVGSDGATALPSLKLEYTQCSFAADGQITTMTTPPGRSPADPDVELADMDGDGLPDLLVAKAGQYRTYLNHDGESWRPGTDWSPGDSPSFSLSTAGVQIADADGDGAVDLLAKSGVAEFKYFPGKSATDWGVPVQIPTVPNVTFEDPDVRLADMDGDRRVDVVVTTAAGIAIGYNLQGKDWAPIEVIGVVDSAQPLRFSDGHTTLCDVNGDRVQDLCYVRPGAMSYWVGRGRGRFEPPQSAKGVPAHDPSDPWQLHDLDGDGWADWVRVGVTTLQFALATGVGQYDVARTLGGVPERAAATAVRFADMNASGTTDIVWIDVSGAPDQAWRYLELFPNGRAGLLSRIDNGLGKVTNVSYASAAKDAAAARAAGKPWVGRMNVAMAVVKRVEVDASLGDPMIAMEYVYRDGTYAPRERTFATFAGGAERQVGDEHTPTLILESTFDPGVEHRTLRGAVLRTEARDEQGYVFSRTTSQHATRSLGKSQDGRDIEYSYKRAELIEHVEGSPSPESRTTLTEWEQDDYGNLTTEWRWGEVVGTEKLVGGDEAITRRTFANNVEDWILGRVATEELIDGAGSRVSMVRSYYDGAPFQGLTLGLVARGDLSRVEEWVGPSPDSFELESSMAYDSDGHLTETKDSRGGGRLFEYDPVDRVVLRAEGVKLDGRTLRVASTGDAAIGRPLSITGYDGQTTTLRYDALARLVAMERPGDSPGAPSVRYSYETLPGLSRVITERRVSLGGDLWERTEELYDGLGRRRAALTKADEGTWALGGVVLFDRRGEQRKQLDTKAIPTSERDTLDILKDGPGVEFWRDAIARPTETVSRLGTVVRNRYSPFSVGHWDGAQADLSSPYEHTPVVTASDGLGRTVLVRRTLQGAPVDSTFEYDAAGSLVARVDPEGNVSRYAYDGRRRLIVVDDPDTGERSFSYDATGNLLEVKRPDGSRVVYAYDLAGRELSVDMGGDGSTEVTRIWDLDPANPQDESFRGRSVSVSDPTGSKHFAYDARGRVVRTEQVVDGRGYTFDSAYDNLDRLILNGYPDGSSIRIRFNLLGQPVEYGRAIRVGYDPDGVESSLQFNTAVVAELKHDEDQRPVELKIVSPSGSEIEHLSWRFDGADNPLEVDDLRVGIAADADRTEHYSYDNLYRLRKAQAPWGWAEWAYSPSGNTLSRSSSVPLLHAGDLAFGQGAGPHAMTRVGTRTISYDLLGRMKSDGERSYGWNELDQLVRVESVTGGAVTSRYDADGIRIVREEATSGGAQDTAWFLSPWAEVRNGKLVRYVVHGGRRVARLADATGRPPTGALRSRGSGPAAGSRPHELSLALLLLSGVLLMAVGRTCRMVTPRLRGAGVALALALWGCSDSASPQAAQAATDPEGTVIEFGSDDTLLHHDPLGSLLAETSGVGAPTAAFATYPYGLVRYDTSSETRKFAGAPRDESVYLDAMGRRFYAPDLGVWTSPDPAALESPESWARDPRAPASPYAYGNLSPISSLDQDGDWAGAVLAAVVVVGMGALVQHSDDWAGHAMAASLAAAPLIPANAYRAAAVMAATQVKSSDDVAGHLEVASIAAGGIKPAPAPVAPPPRIAATRPNPASAPKARPAPVAKPATPSGLCFVAGTLVTTAAGLVPIESLHVGDRVLTMGDDSAASTSVDETWRDVRAAMPNPDGSGDVIELEMLRPSQWLSEVGAAEGKWIGLSLDELELIGPAQILSIDPVPEPRQGPGHVVLATMSHWNGYVLDLRLEGTGEVLGATDTHRFLSLERGDWVPARELEEGELLAGRQGPVRLLSIAAKPGVHRVFNLEVEGEHSYTVSRAGVLCHNTNPCAKPGGASRGGPIAGKSGPVFKTTKEAAQAANGLGFSRIKETSNGQAVFSDGKRFITRDVDGHNGGAWKMADSVKNLGKKETRLGTFDSNLNRIGD